MAIQLGVLGHRQTAHMWYGGQPNGSRDAWAGMLHDNGDGRTRSRQGRMLEGPHFYPPCNHQPRMSICAHFVGVLCL